MPDKTNANTLTTTKPNTIPFLPTTPDTSPSAYPARTIHQAAPPPTSGPTPKSVAFKMSDRQSTSKRDQASGPGSSPSAAQLPASTGHTQAHAHAHAEVNPGIAAAADKPANTESRPAHLFKIRKHPPAHTAHDHIPSSTQPRSSLQVDRQENVHGHLDGQYEMTQSPKHTHTHIHVRGHEDGQEQDHSPDGNHSHESEPMLQPTLTPTPDSDRPQGHRSLPTQMIRTAPNQGLQGEVSQDRVPRLSWERANGSADSSAPPTLPPKSPRSRARSPHPAHLPSHTHHTHQAQLPHSPHSHSAHVPHSPRSPRSPSNPSASAPGSVEGSPSPTSLSKRFRVLLAFTNKPTLSKTWEKKSYLVSQKSGPVSLPASPASPTSASWPGHRVESGVRLSRHVGGEGEEHSYASPHLHTQSQISRPISFYASPAEIAAFRPLPLIEAHPHAQAQAQAHAHGHRHQDARVDHLRTSTPVQA